MDEEITRKLRGVFVQRSSFGFRALEPQPRGTTRRIWTDFARLGIPVKVNSFCRLAEWRSAWSGIAFTFDRIPHCYFMR